MAGWVAYLGQPRSERGAAEASAVIDRALRIDARCLSAVLALARIARMQGRLDDAREHLDRARSIAPDDPEVEKEAAVVTVLAGQSGERKSPPAVRPREEDEPAEEEPPEVVAISQALALEDPVRSGSARMRRAASERPPSSKSPQRRACVSNHESQASSSSSGAGSKNDSSTRPSGARGPAVPEMQRGPGAHRDPLLRDHDLLASIDLLESARPPTGRPRAD